MQRKECLEVLNLWIIQVKKKAYVENIQAENADELLNYKDSLEDLESKLAHAIQDENISVLQSLEWPEELMECIKDMQIKSYILDCIQQAFTIHHFNKSPMHETELQKEKLD
uniref:Uncharacterized protein n=1 Tax=viral metagenome TaxID=1070528 RepID=A0A6C0AN99_9ZZZZ